MGTTNNKPIIFLAFANDRDDTVGYLRNLPDEARRVRDVLSSAVQAGLCEVEVRSNCTAGDIFKVFQDPRFRNRIAIFHYGGHANGYQLLLESAAGQSAAADAGGLAAFLAEQQGLQLVFLNGCSTQEQTQGLLDANISAVISTSRAIDDGVATDLACQFYQGLASGATIRTAFNEAAAAARTAKGGDTRALYFGASKDPQMRLEGDRWPWNLYLRDGSEHADLWNLPDAINNPLFGLPPLPELDLPESPYRNLNWFTRKHAEVFFGRGHQIRELYERLTAPRSAPIIMFYGQSGVGKSSILDAGLMPRLERDFEVRYLRRTESGLLDTLQLAFLPEASGLPVETAWRVKEKQTGKPLIVILDQVEEIYTRPIAALPNELDDLLKAIQMTFAASEQRPQGKLVLGFRKEWLAELEAQMIKYELSRTKVFLERLDRRGIVEVVLGPTRSDRLREHYGLTIDEGLAEIIADDLLADRGSAISTTLQILLSKMWTKATEANYEQPKFSHDLYHDLQREGILLSDFLDQQLKAFHTQLPEPADSGLLLDVLAQHTTSLGTSNQCSRDSLLDQYAHVSDVLPKLLQQSQDLYLLTEATSTQKVHTKTTRLAHDTLAPLVRERFEVSDRPGQRARRVVDNRSVDWENGRHGEPLDAADLKIVERGVAGTRALNPTEQKLLRVSQQRRSLRKFVVAATATTVLAALALAFVLINGARKSAVEAKDESLRRLVRTYWTNAVNERDRNDDWVKSSQYFIRAAALTDDPSEHGNARLASWYLLHRARLVAILEHSDWINGSLFFDDESKIVTWSEDGTARVWDTQTGEPITPLLEHDGEVNGVALSSDEKRLLTCSGGGKGPSSGAAEPGAAKVWDSRTGKLITTINHKKRVNGAAWSRDETRIFTWSDDHSARISNSSTGEPVIPPLEHEAEVHGATVSIDERRCLTWCGSYEAPEVGSAKVWDVNTGDVICSLPHAKAVNGAKFSDDEQRVLTWSNDGTARLWDATTGDPITPPLQHKDRGYGPPHMWGALFSRDGSRILSWGDDYTARLWDSRTGAEVIPALKHDHQVIQSTFNRDESRILTRGMDAVKLWDAQTGAELVSIDNGEGVHAAIFSRDERRILCCGADGTARLWDIEKNEEIISVKHHESVMGAVFDREERRMLTWSRDGSARVWDARTGAPLTPQLMHSKPVSLAEFNKDETRIVTRSDDGTVRVWEVEFDKDPPLIHGGFVYGAEFSRDRGRILAWRSNDARVFQTRNGIPVSPVLPHDNIDGVCFSFDETRILTWSGRRKEPGTIKSWDAKTGELRCQTESGNYEGAAFSHDGSTILCWTGDGIVRVVTSDGGVEKISVSQKPGVAVHYAMYTKDDKHFVTCSADGTARIWESKTGKPATPFLDHDSKPVKGATFNRDESRLLTWCGDLLRAGGAARVWDTKTGKPITVPMEHDECVSGAVFNENETLILSWSGSMLKNTGTARVWDAVTGHPVTAVMRHTGRILGARFNRAEDKILVWSTEARVWDAQSGMPVTPPLKHEGTYASINGAVFNDNETRVLTWGDNGTANIWDVRTGDLIVPSIQHERPVREALFSEDENHLFTFAGDCAVRVWDLEVDNEERREVLVGQVEVQTGTELNEFGELQCFRADALRAKQEALDLMAAQAER